VRDLQALIGPSLFKSPVWRTRLQQVCAGRGLDEKRAMAETDPSDLAEGLYIKIEEGGRVVERYKFIRESFLTAVVDSETHWLNRPLVPNLLSEGVDLFGSA
jgi:hypothetical protein